MLYKLKADTLKIQMNFENDKLLVDLSDNSEDKERTEKIIVQYGIFYT